MTVTEIVSANDGGRITVSDIVANPLFVPTKLAEILDNQFISQSLFRNAGPNPNGVAVYRQGDPMFLDDDVQDVAEFGEIPVSTHTRGVPQTAFATKKALGIRISKEMIDENNIGEVNRQMNALKNTFIRANDRAAKAVLQSALIPTQAVTTTWSTSGSTPRGDIMRGIETIQMQQPSWSTGDEYYGFEPDTLVCHPGILPTLMYNSDWTTVFNGNIASENIKYTGLFPGQIYGLDVLKTRSWPTNAVLLCQREVLGFYSDTRPMQFTALYPEGNGPNGGPTETWRSDASTKRLIAADQPTAALWLTAIQ